MLLSGGFIGGVGQAGVEARDLRDSSGKPLLSHVADVHSLMEKSLGCERCGLRLRIDGEVKGVTYCQCKDSPRSVYMVATEGSEGWKPFIEREDILVWRREHKELKGMYEYKMYGNFNDVSLEEFISVQEDLSDFRFTWDKSTKKCNIVENIGNGGHEVVYHWEVIWPRFFSNREYCCHRTILEDQESEMKVMVTRGTDHPGCVKSRSAVRVEEYDSMLVVKPHGRPDELGMEFVLTGFENPGVVLPEAIVTLVAIRLMPEFMINLRKTCVKLRSKKESANGGSNTITSGTTFNRSLSRERVYA